MDPNDHNISTTTTESAQAWVLTYRELYRSKLVQAILTVLGDVLLVASIPMIVLLPELGIYRCCWWRFAFLHSKLIQSRAYAWTDWCFIQLQ
ncbi:hypothetical protein [Mycobacterium leprae]|uniref:hypothetical protein n=1 Tax=Mycobacterium leprae TaxID=1769 RepID=UPI0002F09B80|nr:hypothetical protein [Mycobacterium leprae]OAR20820.1 hypothetical protein A8144_02140 [Mycobacterium leprae 3125609]OAX72024.1 hypothetical protein A3216_02225 [Mycobacterium leprae 7935681]